MRRRTPKPTAPRRRAGRARAEASALRRGGGRLGASADRSAASTPAAQLLPDEATLLDIVDHLLDRGVRLEGDLVLGLAGVDLVYVRLGTLLCTVDRLMRSRR